MRTQIYKAGFKLWLSANDTEAWANRRNTSWPCSQLSGKRLFVEFNSNGIADIAINDKSLVYSSDCNIAELTAIVGDHILSKLPEDHIYKIFFTNNV